MIRGGRNYVSSAPAFSNDGKRLLVCASNSVFIFSTSTGLQVGSLEGHTALVTAVVVVPASSKLLRHCWTASLDGTIRHWDFAVPELIKTVDVKLPVYSMVIPSFMAQPTESNDKSSKLFAYVSMERNEDSGNEKSLRGQIRKCNLTDSRLVAGLTLKETKEPASITISPTGEYFGIHIKRSIHLWKVPLLDLEHVVLKKVTLHHTKSITAIAFHPSQRILAGGDATGRILIWRQYGKRTFAKADSLKNRSENLDEENPGVRLDDDADSCTTWHWHSAALSILSFSSDGAYLYSGGKEGVLVVWQLDTGKKNFLPRIGAPLLFYTSSSDPSLSAISCADNQIHLLKLSSMEILKSISGIKLPCPLPETYKGLSSGVSFDSKSGLIALRTGNYCVQLYSLLDDRGVSEVQVCERNHQPVDEVTVVVTLTVLSSDGSMMCTAEEKLAEEGLGGLVCLKFWASEPQNKTFNLTTIVYEPHGLASISAIAFHPTHHMAVSSSYGGDFKVWICSNGMQKKSQAGTGFAWTCHAVGSFKKKPMTAACFSPDGSVLAVAAETVITLWDPDRNILVAVIGETLLPITTLAFVGSSQYLVSASCGAKPQLSIWSMSSLSLSWSYRLHVEAVATEADTSRVAVLAVFGESFACNEYIETNFKGGDGVILLFGAADPMPLATWLVKKARGGSIGFIPANQLLGDDMMIDGKPQTMLAYVNSDHEYLLFDPQSSQATELGIIQRNNLVDDEEAENHYGYASIYGELKGVSRKRTQQSPLFSFTPSERPWESIFNGSSHNLPPLSKLCLQFSDSLLEKRTTALE